MPRMFKFNILIHHSLSWNINTLYDHFAIQIFPRKGKHKKSFVSDRCSLCSIWSIVEPFLFLAVYTSDRYMEYWLYICRAINWKTSFPWEKCGTSTRYNYRSPGNTFSRSNIQGRYSLASKCSLHCNKYCLMLLATCNHAVDSK